MEVISKILLYVDDWKGLAGWLNINSDEIEGGCRQENAVPRCYRREIVNRCCNRQESENSTKVAEDIANVLEWMDHKRQAEQLRQLKFGKVSHKMKLL